MLRAAVERQCEITGEALAKLAKADEPVAARISDYRRIIAFRIDHEPLIQMIGYPAMVRRGNDLRIWRRTSASASASEWRLITATP